MNSLLPPSASKLERRLAAACGDMANLSVPLRELLNPDACPVHLLPYLAWAWSVDRWDESWAENTKRKVVKCAFYVHQHKGTAAAIRRVVEPFGFLQRISEWWENDDEPGTFRLEICVQEQGISEESYHELERLISDAKPGSRHLIGLSVVLQSAGSLPVAAGCYSGDELTVYPYTPEVISVSGTGYGASAIHIIDSVRVNA